MPEIAVPPPALLLEVLLYAMLPAMALAAFVMAAAERLGGSTQAPAASVLALAVGAVAGLWVRAGYMQKWQALPAPGSALEQWLGEGLTLMPGESSWNRMPWAALAILCAGCIVRLPNLRPIDALILRAGTAVALSFWLIAPEKRSEIGWLAPAFAAIVLAEWLLLDELTARPPGGTIPFTLALAFITASVVLIHAGTDRLTGVSIVLSAALAGIALVAWWRDVDASGVVPAVALLLPGVLLVGQQETDSKVPWQAFAIVATSPLMLAPTLALRQWNCVRLRSLQVALVVIPLAIASYLALQTGPLEFE